MPCPICDQKPMNCDCTEAERRMYAESQDLQEEVERLRSHIELLDASGKASHSAIQLLHGTVTNMSQEIERLRLTDAEREALIVASIELQALTMCETNHSDALRKLLARFS